MSPWTVLFRLFASLALLMATVPAAHGLKPTPVDNSLHALCKAPRGQFPGTSCGKYVNCWDGMAIEQDCLPGLYFNEHRNYCDYARNVACTDQPKQQPTPSVHISPEGPPPTHVDGSAPPPPPPKHVDGSAPPPPPPKHVDGSAPPPPPPKHVDGSAPPPPPPKHVDGSAPPPPPPKHVDGSAPPPPPPKHVDGSAPPPPPPKHVDGSAPPPPPPKKI